MRVLRVGSRGSELALAQTRSVLALLSRSLPDVRTEIEIIHTTGDRLSEMPLAKLGDRGIFIKEIEEALLGGRIDFAVHSMKDLPTRLPDGLLLAAITERLDPRDALIARGVPRLEDLPRAGTLATGSLRRRSQVLALRPDLRVVDLRGNVTTRLRKFEESSWDGIILARAGLERLGQPERAVNLIPTDQILPAAGQGALALQARRGEQEVLNCLSRLHHAETATAVEAERALLHRLEGGCQVPVGVLGSVTNGRLLLKAYLGTVDGAKHMRVQAEGNPSQAEKTGQALAESMLAEGGAEILEIVRAGAREREKETT